MINLPSGVIMRHSGQILFPLPLFRKIKRER